MACGSATTRRVCKRERESCAHESESCAHSPPSSLGQALYATWWGFQSQPHLIWQLLRDFLAEHDPQPNAGHLALAQLERAGCLHAVVTQNVDGLHQAAGSGSVVELHGSLLECVCPRCAAPFGPSRAALLSAGASLPPLCGACGGPLKPSATLFGEALPPGAWDRAAALVDRCDVLLVVGTSASVQPAARLPGRAGRAGATVVELNLEATPLTGTVSDVLLRGRSAAVLPALAARVAQLRAVAGGGGRGGGGGAAAPRV